MNNGVLDSNYASQNPLLQHTHDLLEQHAAQKCTAQLYSTGVTDWLDGRTWDVMNLAVTYLIPIDVEVALTSL